MGASQMITAFNLEAGHVVEGSTNETILAKGAYSNKFVESLQVYQVGDQKIMSSESLSQQGKLAALKKLGTETAHAFQWPRM